MKNNDYSFIPKEINEQARELVEGSYDTLVRKGLLTKENRVLFIPQLTMLGFAYDQYLMAQTEICKTKELITKTTNSEKPNSLINIAQTNLRIVINLLSELGLSIKMKEKTDKLTKKENDNILGFLTEND